MTFQTTVNQALANGVAGDYADDSPRRDTGYILLANDSQNPTVGAAFTLNGEDGQAQIGGDGDFAGILVNSKMYANYNNLTAGLELPSGSQGSLCTMGHIYVTSATAYEPGYIAAFDTTTGAISAYADSTSAEGTVIDGAKFIGYSGDADTVGILQLG